jgi:hypothetical protein
MRAKPRGWNTRLQIDRPPRLYVGVSRMSHHVVGIRAHGLTVIGLTSTSDGCSCGLGDLQGSMDCRKPLEPVDVRSADDAMVFQLLTAAYPPPLS